MVSTTVDYFYGVPKGGGRNGTYRRVSLFCAGRHGTDDLNNEDRVVLQNTPHGTLLAVVDGVTPRTTAKLDAPEFGEYAITTGRLGALIVEKHIRALTPGMSLTDLVKIIYEDWLTVRSRPDFPPGEIVGAVFALMVPWDGPNGSLWKFGDCLWGYRTEASTGPWNDSLNGRSQTSSNDALIRKNAIEAEMRNRNLALPDVLANRTLRGDMARLGREALTAHRLKQNGRSWLGEWELVTRLIHPAEPLPADTWYFSLATDGSMNVPRAMDVGLAQLAHLRQEDPLMLGHNGYKLATAKGFVDFNGDILPFTDDVGIVAVLL